MKNIGNTILIVGVLLLVVSGISVFINNIDKNNSGTLLVLGLILSGTGNGLNKKKQCAILLAKYMS